ncbi:hypothetical protein QE250_12820 [Chromatiaceae bacterium AAb-1]|nr:hypothetical protein [Chromatiaceae bacterium AAb-1]
MTTGLKASERNDAKLMLKILIGLLPFVEMLFGFGVGLVMSWFEYSTEADFYTKLLSMALPSTAIIVLVQYCFFKKIDKWLS